MYRHLVSGDAEGVTDLGGHGRPAGEWRPGELPLISVPVRPAQFGARTRTYGADGPGASHQHSMAIRCWKHRTWSLPAPRRVYIINAGPRRPRIGNCRYCARWHFNCAVEKSLRSWGQRCGQDLIAAHPRWSAGPCLGNHRGCPARDGIPEPRTPVHHAHRRRPVQTNRPLIHSSMTGNSRLAFNELALTGADWSVLPATSHQGRRPDGD